MKYLPINQNLFVQNRERFVKHLKPNSIAVFNSNDIMPTNADGTQSFIQNTDMFYLSGTDQEESILLICPDAREEKHKEILFVRETNEHLAIWEGHKLTKEEASDISGILTVHWTSEFNNIFRSLVFEMDHIYLNTNEHSRADMVVETRDTRFLKWCMAAFPLHKYERLAPIMHDLRAIKSPIEIQLIKQACDITEKTFRRLLRFIRPGVWEYEIEAEIYHEFLKSRSRGPAYESIVASGANSCVLHYIKNNQRCRNGDILLMDFGAEYANYASDLTRTIPVNGRFSKRQKEVYNAVLRVQKAAIKLLRPGNTLEEYNKEVGKIMEKELIGLGVLDAKAVKAQDKEKPLYKKYFMHGTSHHLGLDVHDVGNRYRKFEAGMVFTCEPGIYIRDEAIGVRIENDILITDGEPVDLTGNVPAEAEEIEMLMRG
ncbi:aminopeptidase P N-terminal domain-containing protein [Desulfonema magnum]|uniref:Xaa-Pro aminopeptidase n=1 Tax=Desulfonema magnum TaxID=45655 RepID=A0A975GM35_9BACT|nr:aminopeptidase P N-terminal domain-containing protein [Desulfonema magnum]QTA86235.1 Aminopeptidase family protein [Desulfonema magnum]